jgi:hypothetical protein
MKKLTLEEVLKIIDNIRRFDEKEDGVDFFAGWDEALDTVKMDLKEAYEKTNISDNRN